MQKFRSKDSKEGEEMTEMRRVTAICNGTAIDHIPSGHALQVLKMLRLDVGRSNPISMVMNAPSGKMGRKDVLKS